MNPRRNVCVEIVHLLEDHSLPFQHLKHDFVHRSAEAAKIRGSRYVEAAKALICRAEQDGKHCFIMAVVPGPVQMSYNLLKKELGIKKLCLASPEEVERATGLTIGSVPPFGNLWNLSVYIEESLLEEEFMVFSAGSHYDSIRLRVTDYLRVVPAKVVRFKKEGNDVD